MIKSEMSGKEREPEKTIKCSLGEKKSREHRVLQTKRLGVQAGGRRDAGK